MEPIAAYRDTAYRARSFVRLYDALIRTRPQDTRPEWSESFCNLMNWRRDSNINRVDSVGAIVVLREGSALSIDDFSKEVMADFLRSALVYGVSALDRYIHERVVQKIVAALKRTPRSKEQEDFSIPITTAIEITESIRRARRAGRVVRPANEIRKKVQDLLHQRPFQSWREIDYAFRLLGVTNLAGQLQTAMRVGDVKPVKSQLNQIVMRRNYIVHEGDIVRHERGGQVKPRKVERRFVLDSLDFLDNFVAHLEQVS